MRDGTTQESPTSVRSWLADMEFCHIDDGSGEHAYCGDSTGEGPITCTDYYGEAICNTCGRPTCPRCAQLCSLDGLLEEES